MYDCLIARPSVIIWQIEEGMIAWDDEEKTEFNRVEWAIENLRRWDHWEGGKGNHEGDYKFITNFNNYITN